MIVAEIELRTSHGLMVGAESCYNIKFDNLNFALSEYHRIADLIERKEKKVNDLPIMIYVKGSGNQVSLPLDDLRSVYLLDFAVANEQRSGLKETFPNLFLP